MVWGKVLWSCLFSLPSHPKNMFPKINWVDSVMTVWELSHFYRRLGPKTSPTILIWGVHPVLFAMLNRNLYGFSDLPSSYDICHFFHEYVVKWSNAWWYNDIYVTMFIFSIFIVYLWISNTEAYVGGYPRIAGHTKMTIQEATPTTRSYTRNIGIS